MTCEITFRSARWYAVLFLLVPAAVTEAHITNWITISNDAAATSNTITNAANSTTIGGVEGYQTLGSFTPVTLNDGQYIELTGTYSMLGRLSSAATDLQRLRDQVRIGLFRAPGADPLQAQNLTGYIIEHRNEIREIRTPILAPATGQSPFVSQRSTALGAFSNAAPNGVTGGNTDPALFTEEDLVTGVDVTLTIQYRIARDGANLDITGTIAGTPVTVPPLGATPPTDSDGAFLETFSLQNYNPAIDLSGTGSDDFDFTFNRVGFLMGGNIDLDLPPLGDYNDDDVVGAADYVVWLKGGTIVNESVTPGSSTPEDYDFWRAQFGRVPGSIVLSNVEVTSGSVGLGTSTGIPEPATWLLVAMAAAVLTIATRRRTVASVAFEPVR